MRLGTLAIRDSIIAFVTFLRSFIFVLSRGVLPSQFKSFELAMEELVEFAEVRLFWFTWLHTLETHVALRTPSQDLVALLVNEARRAVCLQINRLFRADMMQMACRVFKCSCSSGISRRCVGCG